MKVINFISEDCPESKELGEIMKKARKNLRIDVVDINTSSGEKLADKYLPVNSKKKRKE